MAEPRVTVLMPAYNAAAHLAGALDSILAQTFGDFELLVIDDCSTDATPDILDRYADPRLVRLRNARNLGITATLNRGLAAARGAYIARMDADDLARPDRLARQTAYLDAHPNVGLLGARYVMIDEAGAPLYRDPGGAPIAFPPEDGTPGYAAWSLLWMTSVQHPTAMLRAGLVRASGLRYDPDYETAEDYELWARIGRIAEVAWLPDVGLEYRVSAAGISQTRRARQIETHHRVTHREVCGLLGRDLDPALTRYLLAMCAPGIPFADDASSVDVLAAAELLLSIRDRFVATHTLTNDERRQIARFVARYLHKALGEARARGAPPGVRWGLRARLLRQSPGDFARLTAASVTAKLRRNPRAPVL